MYIYSKLMMRQWKLCGQLRFGWLSNKNAHNLIICKRTRVFMEILLIFLDELIFGLYLYSI